MVFNFVRNIFLVLKVKEIYYNRYNEYKLKTNNYDWRY